MPAAPSVTAQITVHDSSSVQQRICWHPVATRSELVTESSSAWQQLKAMHAVSGAAVPQDVVQSCTSTAHSTAKVLHAPLLQVLVNSSHK
jgi:hypothetical protein